MKTLNVQDNPKNKKGTVHNLEEKVDGLADRIDAMTVILTDLRVSIGGNQIRDRRDRLENH